MTVMENEKKEPCKDPCCLDSAEHYHEGDRTIIVSGNDRRI